MPKQKKATKNAGVKSISKQNKTEKNTKPKAASKMTPAELKAATAEKSDKKSSKKAASNIAMYPHTDGKLVPITWEQETDKTVKANSPVHSNSPLRKNRIYKHDAKVLEQHNKLVDQINELSAKATGLLQKVGLHF